MRNVTITHLHDLGEYHIFKCSRVDNLLSETERPLNTSVQCLRQHLSALLVYPQKQVVGVLTHFHLTAQQQHFF